MGVLPGPTCAPDAQAVWHRSQSANSCCAELCCVAVFGGASSTSSCGLSRPYVLLCVLSHFFFHFFFFKHFFFFFFFSLHIATQDSRIFNASFNDWISCSRAAVRSACVIPELTQASAHRFRSSSVLNPPPVRNCHQKGWLFLCSFRSFWSTFTRLRAPSNGFVCLVELKHLFHRPSWVLRAESLLNSCVSAALSI